MLVLTAIADEFPLLAAIAHELGEADGRNEMATLRNARRVLKDAFHSFDHAADVGRAVRFKRCFAAGAGRDEGR